MITDIHCHFVPDEFFRFAAARDEFAIKVKRREGDLVDLDIRGMHFGLNTTFFDLGKQIERMQRDGVERTILSLATPFIDYHLDAAIAVEAARVFNDALAGAIGSDRKRFGGWAVLPMQNPKAAADELRRCVRDYGFLGGHIASNVRGVYLNDEQFEPIVRAATDLNVPLFVHPADPLGKDRMREYELTIVAGYLFDNTINILKMICSGFLDKWPSLKLVCAHAGAFSPILRARMQREVDTNPQLQQTLKMPVGDYLKRLYFDSICFEPAILRYVVDVVPVERVMLGSDAPFPLGEPDPVNFVRNALPSDKADLILSRNFDRMLEA
ncbi:amidohydrolase family protein [Bradyrhizobium sp. SYSU BS000235]|uniref:amidohydrolase family protein n=1 Tax=Bradyrhizobium sp. SYSU BS000235 TaxID=3411332 RepID=UPI003C78A239